MEMERYFKATQLLDYEDPLLLRLLEDRGWCALSEYNRIGAIYDFVRNEIVLDYNESDALPASKVLRDGYGPCNSKRILMMALLRKCGIPSRLHGFTAHKQLHKGVITGLVYWLAPRKIIHSWIEVFHQDEMSAVSFVVTPSTPHTLNLRTCPGVASILIFRRTLPFKTSVFSIRLMTLFLQHGENLSGLKALLYRHVFRKHINRKVTSIRNADQKQTDIKHKESASC